MTGAGLVATRPAARRKPRTDTSPTRKVGQLVVRAAVILLVAGVIITGATAVGYSPLGARIPGTLRQVSTPDHLLGRVNATVHVIGRGVIPLGAVAGGALGDAIGLRPTLLVAAGGIMLGAVWLARSAIWSVNR